MSSAGETKPPEGLLADVKELGIDDNTLESDTIEAQMTMESEQFLAAPGQTRSPPRRSKRGSETPAKQTSATHSPTVKSEQEETIGGEITVKVEPGKAPKLSRTTSHKVVAKPRALFSHLPDATAEATSVFDILTDCHYAAKYLGSTESALECDCTEEWDSATRINHACGEDSDCINRATKMECPGDCGCGADCQNQRFQSKQYANVSVIKTDKKGYGLRTNTELKPNDFIFEYIGEVISEPAFRRRMHQYDEEGIKHFYFMSLNKGEFVDATKKGNLGRFCNHSCNPNCYVDKWVVGDKLRMGIFAERRIEAGEELVFNYNVDRYGADPQPCYCGEPNCSGYIGGKTQTGERATQLSTALQSALGIYDSEDWETAVTKKPRKKKVAEDDEEYVDSVEVKPLDLTTCVPLMSELFKTEEKWIIVKLLDRIQRANDEKVHTKIAKLHGYRVLNRLLKKWMEDSNVVLQVFDVLNKIPRLTRNKIVDSGIDKTVEKIQQSEDENIKAQATQLLGEWSKLELGYRIPRVKRDPNAAPAERKVERPERRGRNRTRSRSRSKSVEAPRGPSAPSGPRSSMPQRGGMFQGRPRPPFRPPPNPLTGLPQGWFEAADANGATYYYNATGATTWQKPTLPAMAAPPPPPPKAASSKQILDDLINEIISKGTTAQGPSASASATPTDATKKETKEEKWRSLPEEKRKKVYENTLFPIVLHIMGKFKGKLERDDLKRFGKEVAKKLVESDFKNDRVKDPNKIDAKQEKAVKKYVTSYFEKAVEKKKSHDKRKAENGSKEETPSKNGNGNEQEDDPMEVSDNELEQAYKAASTAADAASSPGSLKRRREEQQAMAGAEDSDSKKPRTSLPLLQPPPPPPPPPPRAASGDMEDTEMAGTTPKEGGSVQGLVVDPTQTATPPTTGSPDDGEHERRKNEYSGMNPERLRSLGVTQGEAGS